MAETGTFRVKRGLAEMLKGGVIMDVVTPEQARIAEDAGAVAVMALERVPADIRRDGGVARMSDPTMIKGIQEAVTIPVMAKARIGHFAEARSYRRSRSITSTSPRLTPADEANHIAKHDFDVPLFGHQPWRGAAADLRGRGDDPLQGRGRHREHRRGVVRHLREITGGIRRLAPLRGEELAAAAKEHRAPIEVVEEVAREGLGSPSRCSAPAASRLPPTRR